MKIKCLKVFNEFLIGEARYITATIGRYTLNASNGLAYIIESVSTIT